MISIPDDYNGLPLPLDDVVCDFEECKSNFLALLDSLPKLVDKTKTVGVSHLKMALKRVNDIFITRPYSNFYGTCCINL